MVRHKRKRGAVLVCSGCGQEAQYSLIGLLVGIGVTIVGQAATLVLMLRWLGGLVSGTGVPCASGLWCLLRPHGGVSVP